MRFQYPKYWEVIGLIIALLTLIVTIAQLGQDRDKAHNEITKKDNKIEKSNHRKTFSALTVSERGSQHIDFADTELSVAFQNINSEEYVSLYVAPAGQKSYVYAVVDGSVVEFKSLDVSYYIQVIKVDYSEKKITLKVNYKTDENAP